MKSITMFFVCLLIAEAVIGKGKDKPEANNQADALTISGGGTFGKAKILGKMNRLAIAQYNVVYKQATTVAVTKREKEFSGFGKSPGKAATGSVTAYLETTDGELSQDDFQEITDHGYNYFQQALKKAGLDTVAWSKISSTEYYKEDGKEEEGDEKGQEQNRGQWWTTTAAFHGNSMYGRKAIGSFAFGKAKRAAKFSDEVGGAGAYLNLTVDFADIQVDVDVKTSGYRSTWTPSYNTIGRTTKMSSKTSVAPFMKVAANGGFSLLYNESNVAESVQLVRDVPAEMDYHTEVSEDADRAKKRSSLFSVSFSKKLESTPVVITTTKDKYKTAAKKALERYADTWIAKIQESRS
jgi:hypothetical protein